MAYLNANIPTTYAQIRKEYLYDFKKGHGEVEDCIIFGLTSMGGRAILRDLTHPECPQEDLMNWSFGIVFLTILLSLIGLF